MAEPFDPVEYARSLVRDAERDGEKPTPASEAPIPGGVLAPGGALTTAGGPVDPVSMARRIAEMSRAGTLPSEAAARGEEAPPGAPGYDITSALAHGLTLGGTDLASGYMRDIAKWQPWGTGAEEYQAARERFATQHPYQNIAGNVVGGAMMPLGPLAKLGGYAAPYLARGLEALGLGSEAAKTAGGITAAAGTGAATGGGLGAITGAIDEFPMGREAMLEGAKHGALWGSALGGAIPVGVAGGAKALQAGRDFIGPQPWWTQAATDRFNTRALQGRAEDLGVAQTNYDPTSPIPGFDKSLAQSTRDPGLTAMEGDLVAGISARDPSTWTPAEKALAERAGEQAKARTRALGTVADPNADPLVAQSAMQQRIAAQATADDAALAASRQRETDLAARQQADLAAQQQSVEQQRAALGATTEPEARGATARDQMGAAKKLDKKEEGQIWQAVDPDNTLRIDHTPVAATAEKITAEIPKAAKPPESEEKAIFGIAGMGGTAVPFQETQALRSRLLSAIREERATNGETPALRRMTLLRESIDEAIPKSLDEAANQRFQAATAATRDVAETYKNQFVGPLLTVRGAAGDYKVPDTNVGQKIIANNESAQAFVTAGGDHATLRGALVDDLQKTFGDKPMTEAALNAWRGKREGALRAVEGFGDDVANVGRAQTTLDNLTKAQAAERTTAAGETTSLAKTQQQAMEEAQRGKIGKVLRANPADVPGIIGKTLDRQDAATQFMRMRAAAGGDADALAGLSKAAVDHVINRYVNAQTGVFDPRAFRAFLNQKEGALQAAGVTKQGIQTLRDIASSMELPPPGSARTIGANKGGTPSAFSNMFRALSGAITQAGEKGSNAAAAAAAVADIVGGAGGLATTGLVLSRIVQNMRANGITNTNQMLARAAADPAGFGRAMLMAATPQNMPLAEMAMKAALGTARLGPALSTDYGQAQQRTRRRGRELLMAPAAP